MRILYNAADVLLSIGNEGFGLPVIEAQSCGLPVIATRFAAQRDNVAFGLHIPADPGERKGELAWTAGGAFWFRPHIQSVVDALRWMYEKKNDGYRQAAVELGRTAIVARYDVSVVVEQWKTTLDDIENWLKGKLRD